MENNTLDKIFAETDKIATSTTNQCINCGAVLENDYTTKCNVCGYDSINEFTCPYKVIKEIPSVHKSPIHLAFCELSRKQCKVNGLDYEICSTFRSLDSFKD